MLSIVPIPALRDNYIWLLLHEEKKQAWVIDPGDAAPVINYLQLYHYQLAGILITHHHIDHTGGIDALLNYTNPLIIIGSEKSHLHSLTRKVKEGDIIPIHDCIVEVMTIPGHTLDHTAYRLNNWLFPGDTLFSAGCGRVFEGTMAMMYASLQKLYQLPDDTQLYCGHEYTLSNLQFAAAVEPENSLIQSQITFAKECMEQGRPTLPTTIGLEKKINPFLRCHIKSIITAAEHHTQMSLKDPIAVFRTLREWKNNFPSG